MSELPFTLRDLIAISVVGAIIDKTTYDDMKRCSIEELRQRTAFGAYAMADAMIAERNRTSGKADL